MKKLLSLVALFVIISAFAFSAPINQSVTITNTAGEYYAYVGCLPTLNGGATISLGNFFTNQVAINVSSVAPQVYKLNGPNLAQDPAILYNMKANGTPLVTSGFVVSGTNNAADKLTGGWAIVEADGLGLDPGEYNFATGDYHMSEAQDFTCSAAPWTFSFQPATLTTGTVAGSETFPITVTVFVQL